MPLADNCVTFRRDVAYVYEILNVSRRYVRSLEKRLFYPQDVVEMLRDADNGEETKGPLKVPGASRLK